MVKNESVIFTASDGENWVTERADILTSDMDATFCTPAKDIINCLSTLRDENVTITLDEETKMMTLDYVSGKINLPYESADDFPRPNLSVEGASEVILNSSLVKDVINLASASTENSAVRPIMTGVHFGFSDGHMTVNGASHKRFVKLVEEASISSSSMYSQFTLPPKAQSVIASVLDGVDEDVKLKFTDRAVTVSNRSFKITARLLEGNYPECDKIIPSENTVSIEVERETMVKALRHVLSIENTSRLVILSLHEDSVVVSAEDINFGRTSEEIVKCKNYTQNELQICFNGEVLSEALRSIDGEKVIFDMSEPTRPALIYSSGDNGKDKYLNVLMPMVMQQPIVQ